MNLKVKIGEEVFEVEVGDLSARPILATIEGETFEVWPEKVEVAPGAPVSFQPVAAPAAPRAVSAARPAAPMVEVSGSTITAPIPGSIIAISVKPGDNVSKGQELCILEAMKMKNAIRASRDGQIAAVLVSVGQTVQKGHPLIELAS